MKRRLPKTGLSPPGSRSRVEDVQEGVQGHIQEHVQEHVQGHVQEHVHNMNKVNRTPGYRECFEYYRF